jgi:hypothetical protein
MNRLILIATVLALAGCAGLSSKEIAKGVKLENPPHYPQSVTLKVESFTEKTNFSRNAEPKLIREAIESVLKRERIFREITADGDYVLTAAMRRVDQRHAGFTARFNSIIDWSLTPRGSSQKIWQERIVAEGTANMGDAWGGNKRFHLAEAWTYSRNIEAAMKKLEESRVLDKP